MIELIYAYSNYAPWVAGPIWWAIMIWLDDDRAAEKSEPGC